MRSIAEVRFFAAIVFGFLSIVVVPQLTAAASGNDYVGAERCAACHKKEYDEWRMSGHVQILRRPSDPTSEAVPLPEGLHREDISYIVGGFRWKALFLDKEGYLITSSASGDRKPQYLIGTKKWAAYRPGERVPYDCGKCHTTGFSPEGNQDGLEGIRGTWRFDGVQCEACHGPGAAHAASTLKSDISTDRRICAQCHSTKPADTVRLKGVFLEEYSEANQLAKGKKKTFLCTDCHNPHLSSGRLITQNCEKCHPKIAERYRESYMSRVGVGCIDCHMPPAGMIAEGDDRVFRGDLKSHLFKIDHRKEFAAVTKDGQTVNPGYLSVDYACMRCHSLYGTRQWAESFAMFAHRIKVTTDIKIMRLQMGFAFIGFLSALTALITALVVKNWLWPSLNKKRMLSLHKHSAWITFAAYVFVSSLCIYFHFPLRAPSKALAMGWFLIHPVNGAIGLLIYGGKILSVRKYKTGWKRPGLSWGIGLAVFWVIQFGTAVLAFYDVV